MVLRVKINCCNNSFCCEIGTSLFVLILRAGVPRKSLLVKLDDDLWALGVGLASGHKVCLVAALPLHEEQQLAGGVSRADDALGLKATVETSRWSPCLSGVSPAGRDALLLSFPQQVLVLLDEVWTVQVLLGLPSVLLGSVTLPRDQVFDSTIPDALVQQLLHFKFFTITDKLFLGHAF